MRLWLLACAAFFCLPLHAASPTFFSVGGGVVLNPSQQAWTPLRDLNELVWDWWDPSTLADGTFTTMAAKGSGTVITVSSNAPTVSAAAGGIVFTASGNQVLAVPNLNINNRVWRAVLLIFKANVTTAPAASGTFLLFNGTHSSNADQRVPYFGYTKSGNTFFTGWSNDATMTNTVANPGDGVSHCELVRLVQGTAYTSIDGGTEVASSNTNFTQPRDVDLAVGNIGDSAGIHSIGWTLEGLMTFQGELTADQRDRLMGWCMWKEGVQANLPGGHPYAAAAPTGKPFTMPYKTNTDAYWTGTITPASFDTSHRGTALSLTGFSEIWRVDFSSASDITGDIKGPAATPGAGPLYAPSQNAPANYFYEQTIDADKAVGTPSVISVTGGNAVLQSSYAVNPANSDSFWFIANIASVNNDGRGNVFDTRVAPTYFEASMKSDAGCDGGPNYAAFWIKDDTEYFYQSLPRTEEDIIEMYCDGANAPTGTSSFQSHGTYHNWPPSRIYDSARLASHHQLGNITTLKMSNTPPWPSDDNLFDGSFHQIGLLMDKSQALMIYYIDGFEVFRQPTNPDMFRAFYTIISQLEWASNGNLAPIPTNTTPTEYIDYVRVLQAAPYRAGATYTTP